ncbi:hypothetical protein [Candidatus Coxiella mudrowiae]|uniref:hypothetical protein n=1 Tax=Candidatus Coxiella mudrowiae TaxID=2054173 RepID=UPI0012FEE90A|nr:hypothetical protein [Candidatus Coxiella mudrowiae]
MPPLLQNSRPNLPGALTWHPKELRGRLVAPSPSPQTLPSLPALPSFEWPVVLGIIGNQEHLEGCHLRRYRKCRLPIIVLDRLTK